MGFNDRISKLKPYLVAYNVTVEDGVQYAALRFPQNWSVPAEEIDKAYGVKVKALEGGVCFLSEIERGSDALFSSIDYVVDLNVKMEERMGLLKEKVLELKKIFMSEDLEKLKTLEFVFKPRKKAAQVQKKKDVEQAQVTGQDTTAPNEGVSENETAVPEPSDDLMDFVEKSIE